MHNRRRRRHRRQRDAHTSEADDFRGIRLAQAFAVMLEFIIAFRYTRRRRSIYLRVFGLPTR